MFKKKHFFQIFKGTQLKKFTKDIQIFLETLFEQACSNLVLYFWLVGKGVFKPLLCLRKFTQFALEITYKSNERHKKYNEQYIKYNEQYIKCNEQYIKYNEQCIKYNEQYIKYNEQYIKYNEQYIKYNEQYIKYEMIHQVNMLVESGTSLQPSSL
jgi:hypothetical protein